MNFIHLIVAELKAIVAKPHNIVVMVAVMCVPLLYAGMFLYGFWDAFGKTGNLPVAVVNQDQGAEIAGKQINAGNDLVKNLKKNNSFDWQFVSEKEAQDGFNNNRYFMTVRIPASFSKNATTLMDQKLKPASMDYRINADYNFISSRMADLGLQQLKTRISNEITKTYAQSMYAQIDQLTRGLSDAASGSKSLASGSKKEVDGLNKLKSGFKTMMSGTTQLADGTGKLASGASQLNNGAKTLSNGVQQYTGAVSHQIVPGSGQLISGLNQLNSGIQQQNLGANVSSLNNGMQEFYSIIQGLPGQINNSINPTVIGEAAKQQIIRNESQIENGAVAQASNLKAQSDAAAEQITGGITQSVTQSQATISKSLSSNLPTNIEPLLIAAVEKATNNNTPENTATQIAEGILSNPDVVSQLSKTSDDVANQTITTINSAISGNAPTISSSLQQSATNTIKQTAFGTAQQIAQQTASNTASQIKSGVVSSLQQKDPTTGLTLNSAAQQLASGTSQLAGSSGIPLIISSVNQAAQGAQSLNSGLNQLNSNSGSLASGASTLASSTGALASGAQSLNNGAHQLTNGTHQLSGGANQLSSGAQKIYDGNTKLGNSLSDAHSQLAKTPTNNAHATQFAQPVTTIDGSHQAVNTFGSGFAPYFISLGLYVGALLLTIIYDLGKPAGLATAGWNIALSKFFITILMSIGQALLIDVVVLKGLGLQVNNPAVFIGFTILTSMSYMAIIQWLAGSFNNEGRFACIVILIFQLVTSGGAYAIQLIPKWLQAVSHVLPMTYSVNGFRNIIDGHQHQMFLQNVTALILFVVIGLTLSIITFSIKFHWSKNETRSMSRTGASTSSLES
ncbi:YhgE/Pip domain-containing protein [Sporolactobacillus shoreae]|uniref:YhgE/Pip domain-containing protein n=1 Tax=Sporolactobacillus shoreae TaxID=1465501 RepID=A0A4Z0GM16_9BACL|nr:YhgE/Pip domain-containing protein [Sporolactobacillus shoreae]TGA97158.1 YhgE/Pip domain-containing protein [Sporolactobacillus shoreae]